MSRFRRDAEALDRALAATRNVPPAERPRASGEQVIVEYGVVENGYAHAGGWLPVLWINGRGPRGDTWARRGLDRDAALAQARRDAEEEAARYAGDWRVAVRPRAGVRAAPNPAPTSKEQMWREFLDTNRTLLEATDLTRTLSPDPAGYAIFDPVERYVGARARRAMRSFHEAFLAAVRNKPGKRPRWTDVRLEPLQEIVDLVGVPRDCPRRHLVLPYDPTAASRGRKSEAETAQLAAELAALGLTFDEALDELRKERATGAHAFVSRNLVLDRLWRNIQAHLDALGPGGSLERTEFLRKLDPRRLTGGSRSRASKVLVGRALALNPAAERNPATGDYLFDVPRRVADRMPSALERGPSDLAPEEREPGSDDEGAGGGSDGGVPF